MKLLEQIMAFEPGCEQEEKDKAIMAEFLLNGHTPLSRENMQAHFTASAWVLNDTGKKVLMAYHNIFHSWAWTGGHADGEDDLLAVAMREVREESGLVKLTPVIQEIFSLEILTVDGHEKRGVYVPSHLHMNVTYLLRGDEKEKIFHREGENSAVQWMTPEEVLASVVEPWMNERIYLKLIKRVQALKE